MPSMPTYMSMGYNYLMKAETTLGKDAVKFNNFLKSTIKGTEDESPIVTEETPIEETTEETTEEETTDEETTEEETQTEETTEEETQTEESTGDDQNAVQDTVDNV